PNVTITGRSGIRNLRPGNAKCSRRIRSGNHPGEGGQQSVVRFIVIGFSINDDVTSPKGKSTPGEPHHRLSSSALDRFTLTRSCEPYVRIICTSEPTRLTRTLAVFPAAAV